jgi:serine phosphatase RsbU (regulator of sigma subunit)
MTTLRHVLLVEDDPNVLHALRIQMQKILPDHFVVQIANDGEEALELVNEIVSNNGVIPLIVTDHQMPNLTGSEFLIKVKRLIPKCRNIMLTGEAGFSDVTKLINEQALYRYLPKPWNNSDLEMTVNSALEAFNQEYKLEFVNRKLAEANDNLEALVTERTKQLELKTKELEEGLDYAQIMQQNLLPGVGKMNNYFNHVDVLFRPYHTVSGDFYSFYQQSPNKAMLVLGDATGHGLAGAFLSNICMGIIDNIVENAQLHTPFEVLTNILQRFKELSLNAEDHMKRMISVELTVVCFDKLTKQLSYASNGKQTMFFKEGALVTTIEEPFQCCRGNASEDDTLKHRGRLGSLSLDEVDNLVLFSDGVPDQFIESNQKKLGRRRLVTEFAGKSPKDLATWFNELQGNQPNIDDATLLNVFI